MPMPLGVPVTITSPGDNVKTSLSSETNVSTSKTMAVIGACWTTSPFRRVVRSSPLQPGGSASVVTKAGPKTPVPSKFLPVVHYGVLN